MEGGVLVKSTLTKIYKYKIRPGTEPSYLQLQEEVQKIYLEHAEVEFLYLKDAKDPLRRTEVIQYFDLDPQTAIENIDSDPRVLKLFETFEANILDLSEPIQTEILQSEHLSASGKIHHVEIYCSSLEKSSQFWNWFLQRLGYRVYEKWDLGISFKLGVSYLVFVQAESQHLNQSFHRCKPGLNHLAFHAPSRKFIDDVTAELRARGVTILYPDKHPYAGGPDSYGVFFEDPERIKVELVARPAGFRGSN